MAIWSKEVRDGFPWVDNEHPKLVNPLLKINLVCELVSAAAIFFLVRLCVQRSLHAHSTWPALVIAGTARLNLRSRRGQRGVARTIHDPRCARLAAVGRLDPAILSLRGARRFKESLVLVRLFAGSWRNAQRTAVVRGAVFCSLAAVAKKMDQCAARACRVHSNGGVIVSPWLLRTPAAWIAIRCCCWCQSFVGLAIQIAVSRRVVRRNFGCAAFVIGAFTGGSFAWFEIGFLYGTKHYPYLFISSCYNLASLLAAAGWSLKDDLLSAHVGSVHFHLTLQWALRLLYPRRSSVVCPRRGATSAKSRSARADCDRGAMAADVRAARSNARALSRVGRGGQRCRAGRQHPFEHYSFHHLGCEHSDDRPCDVGR